METLGGGLKVLGKIAQAERLAMSEAHRKDHADDVVRFLRTILDKKEASDQERVAAACAIDRIIARGDAIASEMAKAERLKDGEATERVSIQRGTFKFDSDG